MKIFTVYDSKAEAYTQPFFSQTNATALRSFAQAANDTGNDQRGPHDFHTHAGDYNLFAIGEWDEKTGTLTPLEAKINLGNAMEFIRHE